MKYRLFTTMVLGVLTFNASAQDLPVSQTQESKKVLIEEFTAFKCGYCPSAHQATNDISASLGEENVVVVGYHFGSLAAPSSGEPDFRTTQGSELVSFFGVVGRPKGPINRGAFGGSSFVLAPNAWATNTASIASENADMNVALDVEIDLSTREAQINAEVFYVNPSAETHYLTIGYYENDLVGPQTTYNASWNASYYNPDGTYNHQHVFRGFASSREGIAIDASSTTVIAEDLTITIPTDINGTAINLDNVEFFAILHEGENTPTTSRALNAAKNEPTFIGVASTNELAGLNEVIAFPNPSKDVITLKNLEEGDDVRVYDMLGRAVDFEQNGAQISLVEIGIYYVLIDGVNRRQTIPVSIN